LRACPTKEAVLAELTKRTEATGCAHLNEHAGIELRNGAKRHQGHIAESLAAVRGFANTSIKLNKSCQAKMRDKPYYSVRTGKNPLSQQFDLATLRKLFKTLFIQFEDGGYFQESLGYACVDAGFVPGTLGHDLDGALLLELRKHDLTPIRTKITNYAEDDLFDMIEFLYEHCSKPIERHYHSYSNCGWHCTKFDRDPGRQEFRAKANKVLALYAPGYELSVDGEILGLAETGLEGLFEAPLPALDPENISARVEAARDKFRRYRSSVDERRDAIRDLANVLEYLRPKLKSVIASKDESDLFNLATVLGFGTTILNRR
jgi:hypothetical protein